MYATNLHGSRVVRQEVKPLLIHPHHFDLEISDSNSAVCFRPLALIWQFPMEFLALGFGLTMTLLFLSCGE